MSCCLVIGTKRPWLLSVFDLRPAPFLYVVLLLYTKEQLMRLLIGHYCHDDICKVPISDALTFKIVSVAMDHRNVRG